MAEKGVLIVVSGFSGAGKGTIVKEIVKKSPDYALSISMTTRDKRDYEVEGTDYFFVSKERFEQAISNGELIEYANYVGNYYGTPRKYVDQMIKSGKDVILEIEMQGALQVKSRFPEAVLVFVTPPEASILLDRLTKRGTESKEAIANRMRRAFDESSFIERYDYVLVNDDLDRCVTELAMLIDASHHSPKCNEEFINRIHDELRVYSE